MNSALERERVERAKPIGAAARSLSRAQDRAPWPKNWRAMSDEDRNYVHAVALRERGARIRLVETRGQSEVIGYAGETLVLGPQGCAGGQPGRRQEMSIDISDPTASEQM